jgi:hypothetical protein
VYYNKDFARTPEVFKESGFVEARQARVERRRDVSVTRPQTQTKSGRAIFLAGGFCDLIPSQGEFCEVIAQHFESRHVPIVCGRARNFFSGRFAVGSHSANLEPAREHADDERQEGPDE